MPCKPRMIINKARQHVIEVNTMSTEELQEARAVIDAELKKREAKTRAEAKRKILELAETNGIDLDVLAATAKGTKRYRNPDNQFETWSGKGRQPKWVKAHLAAGRALSDLEIT